MFLQAKPLGDCFSKGVGGCGGVFFHDFYRVIGPTFVCSRIVDCLRDAYWLWDDKSEINGEWEEKEWCCVLFYCTAVTLQRSLTLEIPRTLIFYAVRHRTANRLPVTHLMGWWRSSRCGRRLQSVRGSCPSSWALLKGRPVTLSWVAPAAPPDVHRHDLVHSEADACCNPLTM